MRPIDLHNLPFAIVLSRDMYAFSSKIAIPSGTALAGFRSLAGQLTTDSGWLEMHGIGCDSAAAWELCSVDALYAGALATGSPDSRVQKLIAASHTHYAPMLDADKPALGTYSPETVEAFRTAISSATRENVEPDTCTVYRGEVDLPVYRRFDFPDSAFNRLLTRRAGLYPNEALKIDRSVLVFVFSHGSANLFAFVYHANHPVTRQNSTAASADYVAALREAVGRRFGLHHCLFLQGCAGDIRPNLAEKRISWLPRSRINWHFRSAPTYEDQKWIDEQYRSAVRTAQEMGCFSTSSESFSVATKRVPLSGGGMVEVPRLGIGKSVSFSFLPYEVSHRYHMDTVIADGIPSRLIVFCANRLQGYLPHPKQLRAGGYEVDGSRPLMGLNRQVSLESSELW